MEFIPGFKWAVPKAFSDAVFRCRFEEGDMLYQTPSAYETDWSKKELEYFIQVVYPSRGGSKTAGEAAVFEKNWNTEVRLDIYKYHEKISIDQIRTTQGRLYSTLWKDDINIILSEKDKSIELPTGLSSANKSLDEVEKTAKNLSNDSPVFVMALDITSPVSRDKHLKIKTKLSKHIEQKPVYLSPEEAGIKDYHSIAPAIQIVFFVTTVESNSKLETLIKEAVYIKSKNAKTSKFRVSAHGRIYPNNISLSFIYQDAKGNITSRNMREVSMSNDYIQGFCEDTHQFKTFRKDRVLEYLTDIRLIQDKLKHHIKTNPAPKKAPQSAGLNEICFTGFSKEDKNSLTTLAKSKNLIIRSSVTKNLNFLCIGKNAGPKKMETARKQGVVVLNENQFRVMLETGELPEH